MSSGMGLGSSQRWRQAIHRRKDHVPGASQYRSLKPVYRTRPSPPHNGQAATPSTRIPSLLCIASSGTAPGYKDSTDRDQGKNVEF